MFHMSHHSFAQWATLFALPHQPGLTLQGRLRQAIVQAIADGRLDAGAALPSSRELAAVLGLSRNTVTSAYMQLVDEGYLRTRERSGVFVAPDARPQAAMPAEPLRAPPGSAGLPPNWTDRVLRSVLDRPTLSKPERWREHPYPFVYGKHDPELFPTEAFRECCMRSLARVALPSWTPDFETDDVPELIEQIRTRLLPKRGVFALPSEILLTLGAQHACYLLADTLFDSNTRVGMEDPGYPHARNSFAMREPQWVEMPVDFEGIITNELPPLDYLFVTPSQQSPTTVTLGLNRRRQLLREAEAKDVVIIEDDYEAENLYGGEAMPALKSLDKTGRVIYVGSLSKSLSPAIRLGYIVAPSGLIRELRATRHAMLRHPSTFLQQAYALFISLGHHESHARHINQTMQERLALASTALRQHLPDFQFTPPQGGASIWVHAPDWIDATELATVARRHGVLIEPGDVFFAKSPYPCPYFRLRLSSIATAHIDAGVRALTIAVHELAQARGETRAAPPRSH
jgi:GntR family transcriptional regulator / MocR family aminotransferase